MIVTHNVIIDLSDRENYPQIDVMQDDQYTRNLAICLMTGTEPWNVPQDVSVVIRYCKSDGVGGEYDTLPDGTCAWSARENVLTLALAPQVLTVPGTVMLSATLIRGEQILSIFTVHIYVRNRVRGIFAESQAYYNVNGFLPGPVNAQVGQFLRVAQLDDTGKVVALEGVDGIPGNGGSASETVFLRLNTGYGLSADPGVPPEEWSGTIPEMSREVPYLWIRIEKHYSDGTSSADVGIIGRHPEKGADGASASISLRYGVSSLPMENTIVSWQDTIPSVSSAYPFLWIEISLETQSAAGGGFSIERGIIGYFSEGLSGGYVGTEPAEKDIPKVFFGGPLQQTKEEAVVPFRYISGTADFSGYAQIKAQGNSSMNYPKKNQTVKLYQDAACSEKLKLDFKRWGAQNKHVYKANWIDLSHARNVVSARLWADVVKSRANYPELPELLRTSPNQGAVDGFPVKVYAGGVYQGRYTLNIPKDKWTFNMDDELDNHCVLYGENYVSGCFRATANINGSDWTDEIHDTVPASVKARWNQVIEFVMNSTDEEFRTNLSQYFYVDSLIDYYLFGLASCGLDAFGKNQIYATYDGQKWIASMYDMDSTWGLYWDGSKFVSASYGRNEFEDMVQGRQGNLLYMRLEQLFAAQLKARWAELKSGALSVENIINRFERFTDIVSAELVKEDYASATGGGAFTGIPSQATNNIQQIRAFALARLAWTEAYITALNSESGGGSAATLSGISATYSGGEVAVGTALNTLTGTVVTATYSDGSTATVNGYTLSGKIEKGVNIITVTYGGVTTTFVVTGIAGGDEGDASELMYELPEATTFDGISTFVDTGIKLFDTAKDFTILADIGAMDGNLHMANLFHCLKEASPWPGLCLQYYAKGENLGWHFGGHVGESSDFAPLSQTLTSVKFAVKAEAGILTDIRYYDNGIVVCDLPDDCSYTAFDKTLILGAYQTDTGAKGRYFKGTINEFTVLNRAMEADEMDAYLNS